MGCAIEALVPDADDRSGWLAMADPVRVVEARAPGEVVGTLRAADAFAAAGHGHAVGFVRYEAGEAFGLSVRGGPHALPLAWFALFARAAVRRIGAPSPAGSYRIGPARASVDRRAFEEALERIRTHIAEGDSYQVNCTFRLRAPFEGDEHSLFADLVGVQRGRYPAFLRVGDCSICSASPELFVDRDGQTITARPMKGTARRGRTPAEDRAQAERLRGSLKERAENVMIVDMMRNDLGRIAGIGTVEVPDLFTLERYPNVWQMTSTVRAGTTASLDELFAATFPSASVTGAPKVRTMEIIRSIEREPRGVYTGAIGVIAPGGRARFNVAIRTAVVDHRSGVLDFGVGSGVVWDSDPEREYEECLLKGSVLGQRPQSFELLETLRWVPGGGFFLLQRHLDRLRDSAEYFSFDCSIDRVRQALADAVASADRVLRVRLLVGQDGAVRIEQAPLEPSRDPLRVGLAARPIDQSDVFLFHKTTNRQEYERALVPGVDDVILWNAGREATESTTANLVVELDGRRVTPPVECGLLAGTFRAELLARGAIVEGRVPVDRLADAARIWLINSVREWRPAAFVTS